MYLDTVSPQLCTSRVHTINTLEGMKIAYPSVKLLRLRLDAA